MPEARDDMGKETFAREPATKEVSERAVKEAPEREGVLGKVGGYLKERFDNSLGGKAVKAIGEGMQKNAENIRIAKENGTYQEPVERERPDREPKEWMNKTAIQNVQDAKNAATAQPAQPQLTPQQMREQELQAGYDWASKTAAGTADTASTQAIRKAVQAARTSGLNRGQAALAGAQVAGDAYTNTYQQQLETGQNRWAQQQQLEQQANQLELEAKRLEQEGRQAEAAAKREQKNNILNSIGKAAGFVGSLFLSDEKFKENITQKPQLDDILKKIKPVQYNYKGEDIKQVGITAQDLEKSPLAGAVVNTPVGKMVDGGQLEGANLSLIIELAAKVKELQKELEARNGK